MLFLRILVKVTPFVVERFFSRLSVNANKCSIVHFCFRLCTLVPGINAGLCDVVAFDRALRGKDIITGKDGENPKSIGKALQNYEKVQAPEVSWY